MLTKQAILRLIDQRSFPLLVRRVLDNGRSNDSRVRQLLSQPEVAVASGLGLALQRLCELSWQVDDAVARTKDATLAWLKQSDVSILRSGERCSSTRTPSLPVYGGLAAAAVAIRGLHEFQQLQQRRRNFADANNRSQRRADWMTSPGEEHAELQRMLDFGIQQLAAHLSDDDGPKGSSTAALEASIIRWQLGRIPTFVEAMQTSASSASGLINCSEPSTMIHDEFASQEAIAA